MEMAIVRVNHYPEIAKRKGWTRKEAIRQAVFGARLSWPTAAKWADGSTEVELDSLERMAIWLNVKKDQLLESYEE